MKIGNFDVDRDVLVVAEIGNNHEGSVQAAMELVRRAAECGAHAVKFQTFQTRYFVSHRDPARYERLSSFELPYPAFEELHHLARTLGLLFISTPLDLESARFLEPLVDCYKIASGDNNFYPLIEQVCMTGKPIILSSGLSDLEQVLESKSFIESHWQSRAIRQQWAALHCVSMYPVPADQANLAAIPYLGEKLGCTVGYSDHTIGREACLIAVALGARIIEKHFTLDKNYSTFRDHQLSADPPEMKQLVQGIGLVRRMLGRREKVIQPGESQSVSSIRRSIVAGANLPRGHLLTRKDIIWIRPAVGLPPGKESQILGKPLRRDIPFGEPILPADVTGGK
jgi:sialic acid synthase SpsE